MTEMEGKVVVLDPKHLASCLRFAIEKELKAFGRPETTDHPPPAVSLLLQLVRRLEQTDEDVVTYIGPDFLAVKDGRPDLEFVHTSANGKRYNGGIIYHSHSGLWSTHT